jgi:hypothetical protein
MAMKISPADLAALKEQYIIGFYDSLANEVPIEQATELFVSWQYEDGKKENATYIGKTIKNKNLNYDLVVSKASQEANPYKSFVNSFKKLEAIKSLELVGIYATTYGIGIFAIGGGLKKSKEVIEKELDKIGLDYKTEYSDAHWVFRYKISKAAANIQLLNKFTF